MYDLQITVHRTDADRRAQPDTFVLNRMIPTLDRALPLIDRVCADAVVDGNEYLRSGGGRVAVREPDGAVLAYTLVRVGR